MSRHVQRFIKKFNNFLDNFTITIVEYFFTFFCISFFKRKKKKEKREKKINKNNFLFLFLFCFFIYIF